MFADIAYNVMEIILAHTSISAVSMIATEQWLLATRSKFTPYAPVHLVSPTTVLPPNESLIYGVLHTNKQS
jgi:hypothetical protein